MNAKSEDLANPYMGQKMLQCGEVQETIKSDSASIESSAVDNTATAPPRG